MKTATLPSLRVEPEFVASGLASLEEAEGTGVYYTTDDILSMVQ